ncbi:rhomboid family GlyGly-CTERM serine protease [Pelomonas saccharophila]|uniref:Rhomboid family GlyGly-CTERM serine protease n=1 Tax=Roseateles saccharophilus TaxID=304 RepID=A0ABU1YLI5_ROSSA|nr:rhombosortase [Roseateles saccharophilus]MDR7269715.1 rhomboid family GlyGly-CTERM serine protease [Roseateles saccharophilus]
MASRVWLMLCAALAALSLLAWPLPREALDWQPALVLPQPWRAVTAAFVHWTPLHLAANLAGCAVLALLGWRAGLGPREALAGLIALPLTQLGLLLRPELQHYAGLSGELHALAAVAALTLFTRRSREHFIGAAIAVGLVIKLLLEDPLGPVLRSTPGFDFEVAPWAHLCGAVAGTLAWGLTMRRSEKPPRIPHGT